MDPKNQLGGLYCKMGAQTQDALETVSYRGRMKCLACVFVSHNLKPEAKRDEGDHFRIMWDRIIERLI
jgi:hypothetical protein